MYEDEIKNEMGRRNGKYLIWYTGSREQAEYISYYSKYLRKNSVLLPLSDEAIKKPSDILPKKLIEYLFLDFPDIIITDRSFDKDPLIMGLEILEQKPVGYNHIQRFPRGCASAIKGIPFAYLLPQQRYLFDKCNCNFCKKKEFEKCSQPNRIIIAGENYKENLRSEYQMLFSLLKLMEVHNIPCLAFFWPIDEKLKYLSEGLIYNDHPKLKWKQLPPGPKSKSGRIYNEIKDFFNYIDLVINYFNKAKPYCNLIKNKLILKHIEKIRPKENGLYTLKHVNLKVPDNGNIKIASKIETRSLFSSLQSKTSLLNLNKKHFEDLSQTSIFKRILERPYSIVIDVDADPFKESRGFSDPYSGIVSAFDYRYCREINKGKTPKDHDYNLIFMCLVKNASKWMTSKLKSQFNADNLDNKYPLMKLEWNLRAEINDTFEITQRLSEAKPNTLTKELKNFFYFCDLIIFEDNLFIGTMHF